MLKYKSSFHRYIGRTTLLTRRALNTGELAFLLTLGSVDDVHHKDKVFEFATISFSGSQLTNTSVGPH